MYPIRLEAVMQAGQRSPSLRPSRGVTLIEILVGIAIGLIGMLVMFQTITVWDARTRVSTSSGDAQIAGSLAMFNLERDLRLAGMGFGGAGTAELGCVVYAYDNTASAGGSNFNLRPVNIVDGDPAGVPDTIEVLYGNSPFFAEAEEFTNATASTLAATVKYGFKRGDVAVMTDKSNNCRLLQITDDTTADPNTLSFGTGTYSNFYDNNPSEAVRWNSAAASVPAISAGNLYNMGPAPRDDLWSVNTASTTLGYVNSMSSVNAGLFLGVAEGVVDMKAQYGYDADADKRITDAEWTKTPPADWTKVRAIRVALLVRSRDFEQPPTSASDVTTVTYRLSAPPTWFGQNFAMKNLDGTPDSDVFASPNNWRYYRYRVYEKVIPLRNMIWGQP
jgi:type IV pilus assembly protein PilW